MDQGHILLVEDDENLGYLLKENLEQHGFKVDWKIDGQKGWDIFNEKSFKICLVDVIIPGIDGLGGSDPIAISIEYRKMSCVVAFGTIRPCRT